MVIEIQDVKAKKGGRTVALTMAIFLLFCVHICSNAQILQDTLVPTIHNNKILITLHIQGKDCRFVFDTGAEITIISNELLREIGIGKNSGDWQILDPLQRTVQTRSYSIENATLGKTTLTKFTAVSADLSTASTMGCEKVDGILGLNVIGQFVWQLQSSRFIFSKVNIFDTSNTVNISLNKNSKLLEFAIQLSSTKAMMMFDTGSDQFITIGEDQENYFSPTQVISGEGYTINTIAGRHIGTKKRGIIKQLYIGNYKLENTPVSISGNHRQNLFGAMFLNDRTIILDVASKKLFIKHDSLSTSRDSLYFTSAGMVMGYVNNTVKIVFVWKNSAASQHGIKVGDFVLSVNNQTTENLSVSDWCMLRKLMEEYNQLEVTIKKESSGAIERFVLPVLDLRRVNAGIL